MAALHGASSGPWQDHVRPPEEVVLQAEFQASGGDGGGEEKLEKLQLKALRLATSEGTV